MCLRGVVRYVFTVVTQRPSLGGALGDDTKNGCVADYSGGLLIRRLRHYDKVSSTAVQVQIKMMRHLTITRSRNIWVEVLREMSVLFFKPNLTFLLANKIKEIFIKPT